MGEEENRQISELKENNLYLPENISEAIKQIALDNEFLSNSIDIDVQIEPNTDETSVMSIFRIIISGQKNQNNDIVDDKLVLLCKIIRYNSDKCIDYETMLFVKREIFVYNELLPCFKQFQIDKGIKENEGFFSFPKCYIAFYDEQINKGYIILEDLREFKKLNKYKPATYAEAKAIMIALGRLHALSLAMKEQEPDTFEKFKLINSANKKLSDIDVFLDTVFTEANSTLENHEQHLKKQMELFKTNYWKLMAACKNSADAESFAVLSHGDCWINNLLYTDTLNSSQLNVCLINWQNCCYCSPVLDLLYYIFNSTDQETRFEHYNNFIHIYYDSLATLLKKLDGDASRQFPISVLQNHLKLFGKYGIGSAIFLITMQCNNIILPYIEQDTHNAGDLVDDTNIFKYNERMSSIIRDTFNLGYL